MRSSANKHARPPSNAGDPARHILITGASSGIGAALARTYAAEGCRLTLGGRDTGRLDEVAEACRALGALVEARFADVTDREAMETVIIEAHKRQPLDLVIANAGISGGDGLRDQGEARTRHILQTNIDGVVNTVLPALAAMRTNSPRARHQRRGQIGIMSSLAGFRGLPGAPAYCASKAAVRIWGEALRGEVAREGIGVSVICPGFVETPMTASNPFRMPFLMDSERAARRIVSGLRRNRARIVFPIRLYLLVRVIVGLPVAWTDPWFRRLPGKN